MNVTSLRGIGKMAGERMAAYDIFTVEDLDEYIFDHTVDEVYDFVFDISRNVRGGECLEGYYPRTYNKRIREGLLDHIMGLIPNFVVGAYHTYRAPVEHAGAPVLHCKRGDHHWGPYVAGNDVPNMGGEDYAFRAGAGDGYRYGKSCVPEVGLTLAERDMLLRTDDRYKARRYYGCDCFRSRSACSDFNFERNNRVRGKKGRPTRPYCRWRKDRCNVTGEV